MSNQTFFPICQHRGTGALYFFRGGITFENIVTKQTGEVDETKAAKCFSFCPELSEYANEFVGVVGLLELGAKLVK
jgi:hypothetical protein